EGDVERDLEPQLARAREQRLEILECAELRVQRRVAAFIRADRPGAADVVGRGGKRVVAPLAPLAADGMDGRQVRDIEAHGGDIRKARDAVAKGSMFAGAGAARAGKELVPCAASRSITVDDHCQLE